MPAEQIFAGIFLFPQKRSVAILPNLVTSTAQRKEPKGTYLCILGSSANDPWVIHYVPKGNWSANLEPHISSRKTCLKIPLISSPYTLYNVSSTKTCRDAFLRLSKQDCRIKSPVAKTWQLSETQEGVSTVWQ